MTLSSPRSRLIATDVARGAAGCWRSWPAAPAARRGSHARPATADANKVDINGATRNWLMKLPAIGETIAGKIIAGRP